MSKILNKCSWRNINAFGALASMVLWGIASWTNWIASVKFVSHVSMLTMVFTFVAAWRADVPDKEVERIDN